MTTYPTSDSKFESDIINSKTPVIVDFWAEWCGPCKQIGPILEEISDEKQDSLYIYKLNVDENPTISQKYGIRGIPTLMIFKGGKLVDTKIGKLPKSSINDWIERVLNI